MMTTGFGPARDERGSAILISLVLIFVMAVLGLALYNLGVVESRLVYTTQDDARAFEIAQAGVERALWSLQDTYNNHGQSWAAPASTTLCSGGGHAGCSDSQFYPVASGYISSTSFDTGSYSIEFMQVTAQTLSIPCKTDTGNQVSDVDATKKICDDLIFARVTGTLTNSREGYSPTRTVQLLARATLVPGTCLICGGLTGAAATGQPINGNARIAGSIQIAGKQGTPSLSMSGASGQTNSYTELDSVSLVRIPKLPLVCPFGPTCTLPSQLVESLGATLKVSRPTDVPAVTLGGAAALGQNGNQTYSADATRKGKGPLDGIFVADGCNMPCTDNFTGVTVNSNVFVDDNNITKPALGQVAGFPLLTASWQVFGVPYTNLACPVGSSCTAPTIPPTAPSGTSEFFVSRAANVMVSGNCTDTVGGTGCDPIINSLGSAGGLTDATAAFSTVVRFYDQNNTYMKAQICWRRPALVSAGLDHTLEFGGALCDRINCVSPPAGVLNPTSPTCDSLGEFDSRRTTPSWVTDQLGAPATSAYPLILYLPSSTPATTGFNVQRVGGPSDYSYRGSAWVLTNGLVQFEERWQTCRTTGAGSPCLNHQFTADSSLTVMTWGGNSGVCASSVACGNMYLADGTSNVDRIMGLFYAGCDPSDPYCSGSGVTPTKGFLRSRKQTNTVGTAMGFRLCFAGGTSPCPSGGNVPSFFQVIPDANNLVATIAVPGGGVFTVASVSRYWVECKRTPNADGTFQALTTGLCSYQS